MGGGVLSAYFVFGLPRSRTAWLSLFLSQSGVYCYHEAINGCRTIDEYTSKIEGSGDSTTGFAYTPQSIYRNKPVLIIEKSKEEIERCVAWCNRSFHIDSEADINNQYEQLMSMSGMRVRQSDITDSLPMIFEHLTGAEWRDEYALMERFNIQSPISNIDYIAMDCLIRA